MALPEDLSALPKAELHVHLEGSTRPETLLELAERNLVDLPYDDVEGLRRWFEFRDFDHFIEVYLTITRSLRSVEDYELIIGRFAEELARQRVRYAEVTFSPSTHEWLGIPEDVWKEGLIRGRRTAREEFGVRINWIFDIVRNAERDFGKRYSDYTVDVAIEMMEQGVVALGLGGSEPGFPPENFEKEFRRATGAGLHSAPHAGEHSGPESVWGAIRALGAERIGHGVRSIEDPELVSFLARERIALEISPTSNVRLGVFESFEEHPLRDLYEAGVVVTVNSDDPPLFNTSLNEEVELLRTAFGLEDAAVKEILDNAVAAAFDPAAKELF
jgi:aminodeoxyfutalosine deaminase